MGPLECHEGDQLVPLPPPDEDEQKKAEVRFAITNNKKVGILKEGNVNSDVVGYLEPGTEFAVAGASMDERDGRRYLKLADGSGWVPTHSRKDANKLLVQEVRGDESDHDMGAPMSAAGPAKKRKSKCATAAAAPPKKVKVEPTAEPAAYHLPKGRRSTFTLKEMTWIANKCSAFCGGVRTAAAPPLKFLRDNVAMRGLKEGVFVVAVNTANKSEFFKFVERVRHVARSWPQFETQSSAA